MEEHDCLENYKEIELVRSEEKIVSSGYCSVCQIGIIKVFKYQGTYDKLGMRRIRSLPKKD